MHGAGLMKKTLSRHEALKRTRDRGTPTPPHLATLAYLRHLEREMAEVRALLDAAWQTVDDRDFRKSSRHLDHAQQRMHRVIKRLARKGVN